MYWCKSEWRQEAEPFVKWMPWNFIQITSISQTLKKGCTNMVGAEVSALIYAGDNDEQLEMWRWRPLRDWMVLEATKEVVGVGEKTSRQKETVLSNNKTCNETLNWRISTAEQETLLEQRRQLQVADWLIQEMHKWLVACTSEAFQRMCTFKARTSKYRPATK